MILAFGIISLASMAVVPVIIGLPLGIMAWLWGSKDLKEIDAGRMNPEGRSMTQIGYILGIIGTIVNVLGLIGGCVAIVFIFVVPLLVFGAAMSVRPTAPGFAPPQPQKKANPAPQKKVQIGVPLRLAEYLPGRPR